MSAVGQAKKRVAKVFDALAFQGTEAAWQELVRGGWVAQAGMLNGVLVGYVGPEGEYSVSIDKPGLNICIASGRFHEEPQTSDAAVGQEAQGCFTGYGADPPFMDSPPNIDRGRRWG